MVEYLKRVGAAKFYLFNANLSPLPLFTKFDPNQNAFPFVSSKSFFVRFLNHKADNDDDEPE